MIPEATWQQISPPSLSLSPSPIVPIFITVFSLLSAFYLTFSCDDSLLFPEICFLFLLLLISQSHDVIIEGFAVGMA
jgi:hypothetical protein